VKRFFRIFELSKNEQRVVLIIMLVLITIALVAYERRIHPRFQQKTAMDPTPSPRPVETQVDD
jgi:ABC-type Fe3+ transport system permease subunit